MATFSELFVKTRPVGDVRVRREAYRIFYTVSRNRRLAPGQILNLPPQEWMSLAEPLCDPDRLASAYECEELHEFLTAMPRLILEGAIPINWSRKPNGMIKYTTDEWGKMTRLHNPKSNTRDPKKPYTYKSPVKRVPDEAPYRPEGPREELHQELHEASSAKQIRHATVLPVKVSSRDENGPQNIHLRHEPKQITVWPVGTMIKPVSMLDLGDGASVDTYDWGVIEAASGDRYTIEFAEHSTIDLDTLDTIRRGSIMAQVGFEDVTPV
jgi:hypothetical protein